MQKCAAEKSSFQDPEAPHTIQTITDNSNHEYYDLFKNAKWLRPHEIFRCDYSEIQLYENDVEPNDIKQGALGVCYLMSVLSGIAEYPHRIRKIFKNVTSNVFGVYGLEMFINGRRKEILVDDYFPCLDYSL